MINFNPISIIKLQNSQAISKPVSMGLKNDVFVRSTNNVSFKGKPVRTLKRSDKKCPTKSKTFECIDDNNNGIISSTDECIHCGHMYYVHE